MVEEDYGGMKAPDYWRVNFPSDDLDRIMWGSSGVPPPPPDPPKLDPPRLLLLHSHPEHTGADDESCAQQEVLQHDNILTALEISNSKEQSPNIAPDKILLEDIVWKQRSGFGKYSFGFLHHEWEQRRVVLFESGMLKYYALEKELKGVVYDPEHAVDPRKSPWVYDVNQEPRGQIDLKLRQHKSDDANDLSGGISHASSFEEGVRRLNSFGPNKERGLNTGGVTVEARERQGNAGPTPFEIVITRNDNKQMWRFCFECQSVQIEWLTMLKRLSSDGVEGSVDEIAEVTEGLGDHGFLPGDHIIRWEILPVLYPIQIHGIVLEAGKNCVIIADFGLASYSNHGRLTTHLGDEAKDDKHDAIMAAWEKIKPKQKKRLNVLAITDPNDIRRWSKINYGGQVEKDKKNRFFSLLPRRSKHIMKKGDDSCIETTNSSEEIFSPDESSSRGNSKAADSTSCVEKAGAGRSEQSDADLPFDDADYFEGEPEWIRPGFRPRRRTGSSSAPMALNNEGQSVFSIERQEYESTRDLPKSDSAKIVLARTHFILENEDLLPPYHVFYSNSECIAVWCKTGRWSTLQAAVYLVSSSVGFGKSAIAATLTVAAAHVVLVPALAVGGLAVVGAPLLFLRKSQEKWEEATKDLTEKFWMQAEPDIFVEAIQYWGSRGGSDADNR